MTRNVQYGLFVGLCVVACFVYSIAFSSALFFDEAANFLGSNLPDTTSCSDLFWSHSRWAVSVWNYLTLSNSGFAVESFRLQNLILHVIIAGVFMGLFTAVFSQMPHDSWLFKRRHVIPLCASGLFLLHPVQAQTALNILHMRLEGLLVLSALVVAFLMIKAILFDGLLFKNGWFFAAIGASVLAVGTKESIVVLPALIFLIDWFFIAQGSWAQIFKRAWMYGIFCTIFLTAFFLLNSNLNVTELLVGRLSVFSKPGYLLTDSYQSPMTAYSYFLTQASIVLHYVCIFFNPFDLCIDYTIPLISQASHPIFIVSLALIVLLVAVMAIAWYFKRSNLFSFGIAWFFVALLPRVTLVPSADIVGDYKTFFASIGMLLMLAGAVIWVIDWLLENVSFFESRVGHTILVSLCMWLALSLIGETKYHCTLWGDHVAFWEYVRAHVPRRAWAAQNLGVALASADRVNEALDCYQDAVRLDPQYVQPLVKLGESCQKNGETARALAYYARAEGIATDSSAELHNNKGLLFFGQGDLDRAEEEFKKALALQPRFANCLFNYANVLKKLGRFSQAYLVVNERIRCSPHTSDEHVQFLKARLAFEVCEYRDVVATLEPCIKKTNDVGLQFMLAASYYNEENYKKAAEWFEKVYAKRPDNLDVAYNYGQSLLRLEKYSAAIPFFQQCAGSEKYPFAQLHAAACLYRNGNHSAARTSILALDSQSLSEPVLAELSMLKQDMRFLA